MFGKYDIPRILEVRRKEYWILRRAERGAAGNFGEIEGNFGSGWAGGRENRQEAGADLTDSAAVTGKFGVRWRGSQLASRQYSA